MADRILLVEDDAETRQVVSRTLTDEGYRVVACGTGAEGGEALKSRDIDAVILDVWLPDGNGQEFCRSWRSEGVLIPVLMLTARTDVASRVRGLDSGADDYLGKPFAHLELLARLRALLRRGTGWAQERRLVRGPLRVDFGRRQAWFAEEEVPLTRREFEVLERLSWAKGHAVSRDDLLGEIWGEASPEAAASLEVIVARLRRKLEGGQRDSLIRTVRGFGYALAPGGDERR